MNAIVYTGGCEYGTDRPCDIGRIEEDDGCVTLAFRYTDDGSDWFPTWVGHVGEAVKVPRGWSLSDEMLAALAKAPREGMSESLEEPAPRVADKPGALAPTRHATKGER